MWAVGLQAAERRRGLLTAGALREVSAERVAELFRIGGETVADPERRAALWRDLAAGLERDHGGEADALLGAAGGRLGGAGGLLGLLARYEAYADPLRKKSFLFAKICARRGWFEVGRPRELGGMCRQRPDAARASRRAWSLPDPSLRCERGRSRCSRRSPPAPGFRRRCSTTCSGSAVATIPTCSAPRAETSRAAPRPVVELVLRRRAILRRCPAGSGGPQ